MYRESREKGDMIIDFRINLVGEEKRERMVYIGDEKLGFRQKIPKEKVQFIFQELRKRFNEIIGD